MKPIIIYASKGDNTEKFANEIVQELDCESIKVTQPGLASSSNLDNYYLIFVGTGIHYGNPNEDLVNYLKTIDLKKLKVYSAHLSVISEGRVSLDLSQNIDNAMIKNFFISYFRRDYPNLRLVERAV